MFIEKMHYFIFFIFLSVTATCFSQKPENMNSPEINKPYNYKLPWEVKFKINFSDYITGKNLRLPLSYGEFKYLFLNIKANPEAETINMHLKGQSDINIKVNPRHQQC